MTEEYDVELWYRKKPGESTESIWQDLKRSGILVFNKNLKGTPKEREEKTYREYTKGDFKARKKMVQKYVAGVPVGKPKKHTVYLDKATGREVSASTRTKLMRTGSIETGTKMVPNIRMGVVSHGNYVCISGHV